MANAGESSTMVVLGDPQGNYYAIPESLLLEHRVPEEHRAELESLLGAESAIQVAGTLTVRGSFESSAKWKLPWIG